MNTDILRRLNELSLHAGRKRISDQTGFLHLHYHQKNDGPDTAIPLIENILFACTLFRSKTADNVQEAKTFLGRLLHFQAPSGNFPVYIHEFPTCHDRYLGFHLLGTMVYMLEQFQQVMGQELRVHLQKAIQSLQSYCLETQREHPAPLPIALKGLCAARQNDWVERLRQQDDRSYWHSPADLGAMLSALTMLYPSLAASPWGDFYQHALSVWHVPTATYAGPGVREFQKGFEPQPTLYDLYMGALTGVLSDRAAADGVHLLHASLVLPSNDKPVFPPQKGFTLAVVDKLPGWNPATDRSFHPLKVLWGSPSRAHSLACQGGNCRSITSHLQEDGVDLIFDLGPLPVDEDREKAREVQFFLDLSDAHATTFSSAIANTFKLDDQVEIQSVDGLTITMQYQLIEGEGQFMGHLMKGNRPSQVALKGSNRYNAYDWQIFLRTLRRSDCCLIKVKIKIHQ